MIIIDQSMIKGIMLPIIITELLEQNRIESNRIEYK